MGGPGIGSPGGPARATLLTRMRIWLDASTWAPTVFPSSLRGVLPSCAFAVVIVAAADGLTFVLEHALQGFAFHGMAGFLALICVAIAWGGAPAAVAAACNAILLSFVFIPPHMNGGVPMRLASLLFTLALGLLAVVLSSSAEARRRASMRQDAERLRLLEAAQQARADADEVRSRLQQVIEALPEAIVLYDAEGRRVEVNGPAAAILGDGALGQHAGHGRHLPRHLDGTPYAYEDLPIVRSLRHGEVVVSEQVLLPNLSSGTECPVLFSCAPLRVDDGSIRGVVAIFQDISALKNIERERENLWATISHDLKNPLTSIYGMGQLLHDDVQRLEEPRRTKAVRKVSTILSATERLLKEINSLVEQSRVHLRPLPARASQQSIDLLALLRQVSTEYQQGTSAHHIQVRASDELFLVPVETDSLHRVVGNMLANAIKYSPMGGTISLELDRLEEPSGAKARLRVTDHGLGIPSADLPLVFDQFFRASNVDGVIAGTGIGLAAVRQLVEQYGGTVSIESDLGQGTTVSMILPLHPEAIEKEAVAKLDPARSVAESVLGTR